MDIPDIDIVKIAQGYGMTARQVDGHGDLDAVLTEAFAAKGPRLICVKVAKGGQKCMGMDQSVNPPKYR
jgi:benzoylformate decarboxylase